MREREFIDCCTEVKGNHKKKENTENLNVSNVSVQCSGLETLKD